MKSTIVINPVLPTENYTWLLGLAIEIDNSSAAVNVKATSPVNIFASYLAIGLAGLFGNMFVFGVIHSQRSRFPNIIENMLRHQAVIDLMTSLFVVMIASFSADQSLKNKPSFLCITLIIQTLASTSLGTSLYNLMLITLEQYFEIVHPLFHRAYLIEIKVMKVICFEWIFSFSLRFIYAIWTSGLTEGNCSTRDSSTAFKASGFISLFTLVLNFIFPVIIMVCCLCCMAWTMHKKTVQVFATIGTCTVVFANAKVNIIKTLALFLVIVIVCWLSIFVEYFLNVVGLLDMKFFSSWIYRLNMSLLFLSCSLNPLVYAIKYKKFRKGVSQFFKKSEIRTVTLLVKNYNTNLSNNTNMNVVAASTLC